MTAELRLPGDSWSNGDRVRAIAWTQRPTRGSTSRRSSRGALRARARSAPAPAVDNDDATVESWPGSGNEVEVRRMGDDRSQRGPNGELLLEARGAVRIVTLNRPDAFNAANEALHGEVARIWRELGADPEVRAIVLTGAGNAFCAGGDLQLLDRMVKDRALRAAIMEEGAEIVRAVTSVRVPIVAAVNGPAVGLGCSLAGLCDLVIVEEQAYFADPHVSLGLVAADGGALTWPLLTSLLRAKEYLLLGERLPAREAVQLGVANRVVPTGTSREVALQLAERIAALPPQAVRETKTLLDSALRAAVGTLLSGAIASETVSFDEPAFQNNLAKLLRRKSA
jgi:enoyl-CoA hydratase